MKIVLSALAALAFVGAALADEPLSAKVMRCQNLENESSRLICYDAITADVEEPEARPASASGNWNVSVDTSPIDDSKVVNMMLDSNEVMTCGYGQQRPATLLLRCSENTTAFFFATDCHMADIQSYGQVTMRIDEATAFTQNFTASTTNRALGAWRGNQAIPLIKKVLGGNTLTVRMTPYSESAKTLTFDIRNMQSGAEQIASACNWSLN